MLVSISLGEHLLLLCVKAKAFTKLFVCMTRERNCFIEYSAVKYRQLNHGVLITLVDATFTPTCFVSHIFVRINFVMFLFSLLYTYSQIFVRLNSNFNVLSLIICLYNRKQNNVI